MKPQALQIHPTPGTHELVNELEMAQALRISRRTLLTLRLRGAVPCLRLGRQIRYVPADVMASLKRNAPKY